MMAIEFLKKAIEAKKADMTLMKYLQEHLEGYSKARSPKKIHASDITKDDPAFCPREIALLRILEKPRKDQWLNQSTAVAFAIGESYHDFVRNIWLRDIAVGHWTCPHCQNQKDFCRVPKVPCDKCGDTNWQYTEARFNSTEFDISGSIDFISDMGLEKHVITEIKSMDKDQFADLVMPLAEHRIRTSLYLRIIDGSDVVHKDKIDLTHARILYVSKGYGKKNEDGKFSPFKEFVITRDDAAIQPYLNKATAVKKFTDKGLLPAGVCKSNFDKRCKSCLVAPDCFGQFYPAGATWTKD